MKKNIQLLSLVLILLLQSNYSFAAKYYFSSSGDDSRTAAQAQNSATPWKSIDKLNAIFKNLQPGDEVLFKRGDVFYGEIVISRSGSSGRPIVFGAYGSGPKPIITSLATLNNWNHLGNGVYESGHSSLGKDVSVVLLNKEMQEMGRYPNSDAANRGYKVYKSASWNTISDPELTSNWTGGEVVIRKNFWVIDRHKISWHSGKTISYNNFPAANFSPSPGYGYFIQNHPNTLDKFGEWYYNPQTKKMRVHFGNSSPSSHHVEVSTKDYLVRNSTTVRHITFDNLHFRGANRGAFFLGKSGSDVTVKNSDIEFSGVNGVEIEGISNFRLEKSTILNTSNSGLVLKTSKGAVIKDNLIKDTFLFPGHGQNGNSNGVGIRTDSDDNLIEYNHVINTGYSGISFHGNNVTIKNNFINYFCMTTNDGGGIYTYSNSHERNFNRKIIGNIILNGLGVEEGAIMYTLLSKPQAEGIYIDDNASHVDVIGNTIAHMTSKGIYLHNANNIKLSNNTVYDNKHQLYLRNDHMGKPLRDNTVENNYFLSKDALQNHIQIMTIHNDIEKLANYNNNLYATPLIDDIRINAIRNTQSNNETSLFFNLKSWQKTFNKDWSSKTFGKLDDLYSVKRVVGTNKYDNGSFDKRLGYVGCANCSFSVDNKGGLDGNALKIKSSGLSRTSVKVGSLIKGKQYILRFSAKSNKEIGLTTFLRQDTDPWETVTETRSFELTPQRKNFETLFTAFANVDVARIMMNINQEENVEFYLDNFEFYEAVVDAVEPSEAILFEYNASHNTKKINLQGEYVDLKNNKYSSSINVEPFSSVLLIKTSNRTVETPKKPVTVHLTSPSNKENFTLGNEITVTADVNDPNGDVIAVGFYNGNTEIGTSTEAPYHVVWENVPVGSYKLTARAKVDNSEPVVSPSVSVDVKTVGNLPDKEEGKNPPEDLTFAPIFINAGTTVDVEYQGNNFAGDGKNNSLFQNSYTYANVNATSEKLYQTERNGENLKYAIPLPDGTYTVKTYHYELWFGKYGPKAGPGKRVFDISIEGKTVKKNFDIYKENKNRPTELTFNVQVVDGVLDLELSASKDRASLSAIAIYKSSSKENLHVEEGEKLDMKPKQSLFLNTGSSNSAVYKGNSFPGEGAYGTYHSRSTANFNRTASTEKLFQTERYAKELRYAIPVDNGVYTVKTYHNELWFGTFGPNSRAGRRVFDISVEGDLKKRNFDLYVESKNNPTVLTFDKIVVKDGVLNIDMSASRDNATISGIEIIPGEATGLNAANFRIMGEALEYSEFEEDDLSPSQDGFEIKIYPNPAVDVANLSIGRDIGEFDILVHNANGQLVEQLDPQNLLANDGRYVIPVSHLKGGIYLVTLVNKKEIVKRLRLIIAP